MNIKEATGQDIDSLQELFAQVISWQKQKGVPSFAKLTDKFLEDEINRGRSMKRLDLRYASRLLKFSMLLAFAFLFVSTANAQQLATIIDTRGK